MDEKTQTRFNELFGSDREAQHAAFLHFLRLTETPVDWAYEVWDDLLEKLSDKDNHSRAIAAQLLCALAKSDPKLRMLQDFSQLLAVTRDGRFVTARHCLQNLWKIGVAGNAQQALVVSGLAERFSECAGEKNCTLIRHDIIVNLRRIYDAVKDETMKAKALALIERETNLKYKKKYTGVWKAK